MSGELEAAPAAFLSTLPAGRSDRRIALTVVLVSGALFLVVAPFAATPLGEVAALIPIHQSALVVVDLITAALLFGQFRILRTYALAVVACGYLFTAFMAVAQTLTFLRLFGPIGWPSAGPQSEAWLYVFRHAGFPLFVIAYAVLGRDGRRANRAAWSTRSPAFVGAASVLVVASGCALLATAGQDRLPAIAEGDSYTPAMVVVMSGAWTLSLIALGLRWWRRPHSVLDLWLMVVLCGWLYGIALAAMLNHGRFDLGFYAGRIYGFLASSFVLIMLLLENTVLYSQLVAAHFRNGRRLAILHEIDRAVAAEQSAEKTASAVIGPLRELLGVPRAIINIFDLEAQEAEWLAAAGRRRTRVGPGVRYSIEFMGDVNGLRRGEPQIIDTYALPAGPERDALLASGVELYMAMPMIAAGELIGAISFGGKPGPFPAEQATIAREVATQLAIALFQTRLYEQAKQQAGELDRRVRERTAALEAANQELEAFSYSVSHDLRAPLRAIDGFASILESDHADQLNGDGRRLLERVRANSQRMGRLIDDLLTFSRLARQALNRRPVPLAELVYEVIGELQPDCGDRNVDFIVGELGVADADPVLLKQALTNLIGNAVKFTRRVDAAIVEVGASDGAGDAGPVYHVKDNGAGFDMRYAHKLFDAFERLHRTDEYEGTGVGLAIVQRVIRRHGGRVWADSRPGAGATFFFTLSGARAASPAPTQN